MEKTFSTALVTGATSGIGKALCDLLAGKNINLMISARNQAMLEKLAEEWGRQVQVDCLPADLSIPEERRKIVGWIKEKKPDLVINNAGYGFYGEALSHATSKHLNMLELDCAAVLELTLEAARSLVDAGKKGVILNVSSASAFQIFPYLATYASCKAFVNQFSQAMDAEIHSQGVRVLTSCPGVVSTHFQERAGGKRRPGEGAMDVRFAAEEIWKQIQNGKLIHIFDWRYRFALLISSLIPKKWQFRLLKKGIKSRLAP